MKKRIAILLQGGIGAGNFSQGYPPLHHFIRNISQDFDVTVYSILSPNPEFRPEGFKLRSVNRNFFSRKVRVVLTGLLLLKDHLFHSFHVFHAFWVYPAGTMAVILGKICRVPSIVTVQGGEAAAIKEIDYGNMLKPWLKRVTLWTCRRTDNLNSISKFLIEEFKKHELRRNDLSVIPFGADLSNSKLNSEERGDLLHAIHVANLTEVKDQGTLLKAFALILKEQPAELRIIGSDYMNGRISEIANELNLNNAVKFLGAIPNTELSHQYAWAHIMIHTSLHEGQSGVVVEAMASGVVVCGTRVGMMYDLGDNYFQTIEVGDYETLAKKVLGIWNDDRLFRTQRTAALLWSHRFDSKWTAAQFGELYSLVIKK